jgi:DnaK suppressor protein
MPSKKPAAKSKSTRAAGAKAAPTKVRKAAARPRPARSAASAKPTKSVKSAKPARKPTKAAKAVRKTAAAARPARETVSMKKTAPTKQATRSAAEAKPTPKPATRAASADVGRQPSPAPAPPPSPATAARAPATVARPSVRAAPVVATAISRGTLQPAAEAPTDGEEGEEGASLLAGPRNVKPYIAKRGEQYMNREQLEHFRTILHSWKRDLMVEVDRTVTHMKDEAANFPDPNDRATQEEEFSLELRTRDRERKLIRKIDEALKRIEDGSYGYCLETGEEIGIKRLEARPVATLSIEAQERRERRERQYGDRDDRYR